MGEKKSDLIDKMMTASKISEETLCVWCRQEYILMVNGQYTSET